MVRICLCDALCYVIHVLYIVIHVIYELYIYIYIYMIMEKYTTLVDWFQIRLWSEYYLEELDPTDLPLW